MAVAGIEWAEKRCKRCGIQFYGPLRAFDYCRDCFKEILRLSRELDQLITADLSIDKIDEALARQVHELLSGEKDPIRRIHDMGQV